jgi:hypothetical protein
MARRKVEPDSRSVQLLEMLVSLQLFSLGASQDKIAKAVGKSKGDVNKILKGVPKPKKGA